MCIGEYLKNVSFKVNHIVVTFGKNYFYGNRHFIS